MDATDLAPAVPPYILETISNSKVPEGFGMSPQVSTEAMPLSPHLRTSQFYGLDTSSGAGIPTCDAADRNVCVT